MVISSYNNVIISGGNSIINIGNGNVINGMVQGGAGVRGNGQVTDEDRALQDVFRQVDATSIGDLKIVCGAEKSHVALNGESNILPEIETRVEDGTLHIAPKNGIQTTKPLSVTLFMHDGLDGLDLHAGVNAEVSNIDSRRLCVGLAQGSNATLSGKVESLGVDLSQGSNLNSLGLIADKVLADLSMGSNASVRAEKKLQVDASMGSNLRYSGNPTEISKDLSMGANLSHI